ncbi:MAG: hypothetical protein WC546_04840 [Candidatus Omnitrophota bacterium]
MTRYKGIFFIIDHLFSQYVSLSNKIPQVALLFLALVAIGAIAFFVFNIPKKYTRLLTFMAVLPLFLGIIGTVLSIKYAREAVCLEAKQGLVSTAQKYYDLEYGYCQGLIYSFPIIVGASSTILALILVLIVKKRKALV